MGDRWDRLVYRVVMMKHASEKAWLLIVEDDGGNTVEDWFPKSQSNFGPGDEEIAIPRWLALDKGLGKAIRAYDDESERRCEGDE